MEGVRKKLDFMFGINVQSIGSAGGLTLGWKNNYSVSFRSFSGNYIDVLFVMIRMRMFEGLRVSMVPHNKLVTVTHGIFYVN